MNDKTALVVLGYRLNDDGSPTPILEERVDRAVLLFYDLSPDIVILSGGVANKKTAVSEAAVMKQLIGSRIPSELVLLEERSRTTAENAARSAEIAHMHKINKIILCSSEKHLNRLILNPYRLFKRQSKKYGIEIIKNSCD